VKVTRFLPSALLALSLASTSLLAQTGLDTTVSLRLDAWSGDRQLSGLGALAATSAWGRAKLDLGDAGQVVGQAWVREVSRSDGAPTGRVRELYWRHELGPLSLRVGRQMLAWGRADGLNPTDNLSPRDFTLLVPEDGEQRHGNEAVSAALRGGLGDFTLVWFPRAASHTIPLPETPGVRFVAAHAPRKPQWALKWEAQGDGVDWSVSYFRGFDPMPDLTAEAPSATGVDVVLRNQRARVLGADLSVARGGVVWRAEGAWLRTDSAGPQDFRHKKPQLWLVAGGEWPWGEHTTLGLQLTAKRVLDFASPETVPSPIERAVAVRQAATAGQTDRHQAGLVWRLAHRWHDDRLRAETSGVVVGPRRNGIARAQLDYALTDQLNVVIGLHWPFGAADTSFGQFSRNRLAFVQLRYGIAAERGLLR